VAFDQSTISDVRIMPHGNDLLVSWTSSAPAGTRFQVYVNGRLMKSTPQRSTRIPVPSEDATIQVGTVGPTEGAKDFSASLPALPGTSSHRPEITWYGGTYLDASGNDDIAGFRIYRSAAPGGAVDYSTPVAAVAAYPGGVIRDGFGFGPFGLGGFGKDASFYRWKSSWLPNGIWTFGIRAYNGAGLEGPADEQVITIAAAPAPPLPAKAGAPRLSYTYNAGTRVVTLAWPASPG
jgi:hypothetical protein